MPALSNFSFAGYSSFGTLERVLYPDEPRSLASGIIITDEELWQCMWRLKCVNRSTLIEILHVPTVAFAHA